VASTKSKARILAIAGVWLVVICVVGGAIKWWWRPAQEKAAEEAVVKAEKEVLDSTSSSRRYDTTITVAHDLFSGYANIRSDTMRRYLGSEGIGMTLKDDGADGIVRINALKSGDVDIAVFTVGSFLKSCAEIGEIPATIVMVVDETKGADAIVGYKTKYPNIDSLNSSQLKFVLTPDSPSETLPSVVRAYFDLSNVPKNAVIPADGAADVYKKWRAAKPTDNQVYVLWEPFVTKMLENPNMHNIVDSSRFRGYIVDVVVVNRDFLFKHKDTVRKFIQSYLRTAYEHSSDMNTLIKADALAAGDALSDTQVTNLVDGIWWKNVQENYAHMGLQRGHSLQHIEDIIGQIIDVLKKTDSKFSDPSGGHFENLYFNELLAELQNNSFHPGRTMDSTGQIRAEVSLRELDESGWKNLESIGTLQIPTIQFARGTALLTNSSKQVLDDLVKNLETWPTYYVSVIGNASTRGDEEANKILAESRSQAAADYITGKGINPIRIRAVGSKPSGGSSVSFVLGQVPY
tara:strand:- start:14262 stop:15815 length:1554 start_codon:yes stop_codon:yes gene_type:complete